MNPHKGNNMQLTTYSTRKIPLPFKTLISARFWLIKNNLETFWHGKKLHCHISFNNFYTLKALILEMNFHFRKQGNPNRPRIGNHAQSFLLPNNSWQVEDNEQIHCHGECKINLWSTFLTEVHMFTKHYVKMAEGLHVILSGESSPFSNKFWWSKFLLYFTQKEKF